MSWKKLILFGDSNTQFGFSQEGRWASNLANMLQRKCDVINRGFSGYNTDQLKVMFPKIMGEFDVSSVCGMTLMLGSNDSARPDTRTLQHVPLERFDTNLRSMIDYLLDTYKLDKRKLIMLSPPRIFESKWQKEIGVENANHFDYLVKDYARVCKQIADDKELNFVDFYKIMEDYGPNYSELLFDGLHLSGLGSDLLFSSITPLINKNIETDLKFCYPYWKDIKAGQTEFEI